MGVRSLPANSGQIINRSTGMNIEEVPEAREKGLLESVFKCLQPKKVGVALLRTRGVSGTEGPSRWNPGDSKPLSSPGEGRDQTAPESAVPTFRTRSPEVLSETSRGDELQASKGPGNSAPQTGGWPEGPGQQQGLQKGLAQRRPATPSSPGGGVPLSSASRGGRRAVPSGDSLNGGQSGREDKDDKPHPHFFSDPPKMVEFYSGGVRKAAGMSLTRGGTPLSGLLQRAGGLGRVLAVAALKLDQEAGRFMRSIHRQRTEGAGGKRKTLLRGGEEEVRALEAELAHETAVADGLAALTEKISGGGVRHGIEHLEQHLAGRLTGTESKSLRISLRQLAEAQLAEEGRSRVQGAASSEQRGGVRSQEKLQSRREGEMLGGSQAQADNKEQIGVSLEASVGLATDKVGSEPIGNEGRGLGRASEKKNMIQTIQGSLRRKNDVKEVGSRSWGGATEAKQCSQVPTAVRLGESAGGWVAEQTAVYIRKLQEIENLEDALRSKWLRNPLEVESILGGNEQHSMPPGEKPPGMVAEFVRSENEGAAERPVESPSTSGGANKGAVGEENVLVHPSTREQSADRGTQAALVRDLPQKSRAHTGGRQAGKPEGLLTSKPDLQSLSSFPAAHVLPPGDLGELLDLTAEQLIEFCNACVDQLVESEFRTPPVTPRTTLEGILRPRVSNCAA